MLKQFVYGTINLSTLIFAVDVNFYYCKRSCKTLPPTTVVNHVSIDVKQGEIVGLLGPNGAGKTTTFYQVVGLIKPMKGMFF
jgi:lipopolysaccharide export system ATP-binding protein